MRESCYESKAYSLVTLFCSHFEIDILQNFLLFMQLNISLLATQFNTEDTTCSKTQCLSFRCYSCKSSFQVTVDCVSCWQAVLFILQSSSPQYSALSLENGE